MMPMPTYFPRAAGSRLEGNAPHRIFVFQEKKALPGTAVSANPFIGAE